MKPKIILRVQATRKGLGTNTFLRVWKFCTSNQGCGQYSDLICSSILAAAGGTSKKLASGAVTQTIALRSIENDSKHVTQRPNGWRVGLIIRGSWVRP